MDRTVESEDQDGRLIQEFPFLSPQLLTFVDWLFFKAMYGSKKQYEKNVPETTQRVIMKIAFIYSWLANLTIYFLVAELPGPRHATAQGCRCT